MLWEVKCGNYVTTVTAYVECDDVGIAARLGLAYADKMLANPVGLISVTKVAGEVLRPAPMAAAREAKQRRK